MRPTTSLIFKIRHFTLKTLLLFILLIACLFSTYAQTEIHGKIVDSAGKPAVNANVLLLNSKDSVLVRGTLSTDNGLFSFENIKSGKYLIIATHTGIKPSYTRGILVSDRQESIDIGTITLDESSIVMANVTVTAKKPLYEQKIDRLVINVASSITSAGSTALDVLERSPGVVVNRFTNSLSINGKGGVIVMINGKRNYMGIDAVVQMLAAMPSANIERIEIITTPPAKYDADGNAGIINIVLKSNNQYGTNGSYAVMAGYSKWEENSFSLNMNHRKGKINVFGNYSYFRAHFYQLWKNYHAVTNNNLFMEDYSETSRNPVSWMHSGQAGLDYELSKKTILGVLFTGSYRNWDMKADNYASLFVNKNLDSTISIVNNELHTTGSYGVNLNTQHTFKPDETLSLNFDYLHYYDRNPNDYTNDYFNANKTFIYSEKVQSDKKTPLKFWIGALDYEKKLSKKVNMEAGVKGTTSRLSNDVEVTTLIQNSWTADPTLSNFHKLRESIGAAYSSFSITFNEKTSMKAGLRYEYAHSVLGSATEKLVDRRYSNLFPTFYILHKINDSNSVNFSYSRRIWRPSFADLAPWVIFYDPKTFQTGNPYLLPSITDAVTASYTYKDKILSISYSYMDHPLNNQPELDEKTNRLVNTVTNGKNLQMAYINLSLPFKVTKWWSMQNNLSGGWYQSNSFYKEKIKQEYTSFFANSTQTFTLPKDISLELNGWYNSGGSWGLYTFHPIGSVDFGVQKKFEKIKSTLSLNARNVLNSLRSYQYVNKPEQNLIINTTQVFAYRGFSITYNHRFGKDTVKGKRERTTGAEDERGRAY